ncbi:MAG TPA: hypothetical protein VF943_08655 [Burkholderiales bacterium]
MVSENETLRWPTNLDRAGIEQRLVQVRTYAESHGMAELAARFAYLDNMSSKQLGTAVVASLTALQELPEHRAITMQLEMVAMNLKNLK